jgi:citrate synthase
VILGYGHAVLRVTDPRFIALHEFGKQHFGDDPVFRIADLVYQVAPRVLKEHGKAKSPYPNVDAITGALLYHYGITDYSYYTVLFGVGLMLGLLAQFIVLHGLGSTLMRPKSVTTRWLREAAAGGG